MKLNGDVLTLCPKEHVRNIVISDNGKEIKIKDKTGLIYTFEEIDGIWTIVLLKRIDSRKRRLNDERNNYKKKTKY